MTTREQASLALLKLITNAYPWASPPARRIKLWDQVPAAMKPCAFLFEGGRNPYTWTNLSTPNRGYELQLFIYIDCKDPNTVGAVQLNNIHDALDAALVPDAGFGQEIGACTLGGLVHSCRIFGEVLKDPGDLDGDGLMLVPFKIVLTSPYA